MRILPVLLMLPLLAGGCVVKTAANVVTLPVRAGAKAVDWTTTSQEEADRNRGREMRKREKECRKHPERCQNQQR
ncbi:hypothetical protein [uncultured Sphingomonas sp.]|uniref:hypothetical protein n=1 Tax=uncultured Sphingomonas sp. TaxID=158754 RepID=UPI0025F6B07F|nr:hypothetical protein [uncultured Sphingomonas sp.]